MINIVNVTQHYGVRPVLRGVSLRVAGGDLVALMGPNGMGKSTLLKVAAGLLSPMKGHVEIGGDRRRSTAEMELTIRKRVVYLPDHPWLPKNSTGREFLAAVGALYDIEADRLLDHVERLLNLFELAASADAPIRAYSNGQMKKLSLCAALVTEAPVLLLDEPFTGGLDPSGIFALREVLRGLAQRRDVTVLLATQIPELADQLAHRVAVLRDGEMIAYGTPDELRMKTGSNGPLREVLERMIHPRTLANVEQYFDRVRQ